MEALELLADVSFHGGQIERAIKAIEKAMNRAKESKRQRLRLENKCVDDKCR